MHVKVHEANTHDTVAGCEVFKAVIKKNPTLEGVCTDVGYRKTMEEFVQKILKKTIAISARITPDWTVLPKR